MVNTGQNVTKQEDEEQIKKKKTQIRLINQKVYWKTGEKKEDRQNLKRKTHLRSKRQQEKGNI